MIIEANKTKNLYEILKLDGTATQEDIKKAYRKCALLYHPDRNPGNKDAEKKFREANEAYTVLYNPVTRKAYDEANPQAGLRIHKAEGFKRNFSPKDDASGFKRNTFGKPTKPEKTGFVRDTFKECSDLGKVLKGYVQPKRFSRSYGYA